MSVYMSYICLLVCYLSICHIYVCLSVCYTPVSRFSVWRLAISLPVCFTVYSHVSLSATCLFVCYLSVCLFSGCLLQYLSDVCVIPVGGFPLTGFLPGIGCSPLWKKTKQFKVYLFRRIF